MDNSINSLSPKPKRKPRECSAASKPDSEPPGSKSSKDRMLTKKTPVFSFEISSKSSNGTLGTNKRNIPVQISQNEYKTQDEAKNKKTVPPPPPPPVENHNQIKPNTCPCPQLRQRTGKYLSSLGYIVPDPRSRLAEAECKLPQKDDLLQELYRRIVNNINPDTIVRIDNETVACHYIVLELYCSLFATSSVRDIKLSSEQITPNTFRTVYKWMLNINYDKNEIISRENVIDLYCAAQYLGIAKLQEQCWSFISDETISNEDTAFDLFRSARQRKMDRIAANMVPRIKLFFLPLVASEDFIDLPLDDVITILSSNDIYITSEVEVFMAGVRWLYGDWNHRRGYLLNIMKCVRFGLISPWLLVDIKRNPENEEIYEIIYQPDVQKMIDDGLAYVIIKYWYGDQPKEYQHWIETLGLREPVRRNWFGKEKNHVTYKEFRIYLEDYTLPKNQMMQQLEAMKGAGPDLNASGIRGVNQDEVEGKRKKYTLPLLSCMQTLSADNKDDALHTITGMIRTKSQHHVNLKIPPPLSDNGASEDKVPKKLKSPPLLSDNGASEDIVPNKLKSPLLSDNGASEDITISSKKLKSPPLLSDKGVSEDIVPNKVLKAPKSDTSMRNMIISDQSLTEFTAYVRPSDSILLEEDENYFDDNADVLTLDKLGSNEEKLSDLNENDTNRSQEKYSAIPNRHSKAGSYLTETIRHLSTNQTTSEGKCHQMSSKSFEKAKDSIIIHRKSECSRINLTLLKDFGELEDKDYSPYDLLENQSSVELSHTVYPVFSFNDDLMIPPDAEMMQMEVSKPEVTIATPQISLFDYSKTALAQQNLNKLSASILSPTTKTFITEGSLFNWDRETVIVFGGIDPHMPYGTNRNSGKDIYRFDPVMNVWDNVGELPEPRHHHAVAFLRGRVFLVGGADPRDDDIRGKSVVVSTVWSYEPVTRSWFSESGLAIPRKNFGLVVHKVALYAVGGQDRKGKVLRSLEKYDPNTGAWKEMTPMRFARMAVAVTKYREYIWAAGGMTGSKRTPLCSDVECYSPENDQWTVIYSLRFPRCFATLFAMSDNLYLIGGAGKMGEKDKSASSVGAIDIWDWDFRTWRQETEMSIPRHGHAVAYLGTQIVIVGGVTTIYMRALSNVESYCCERNAWIRGVAALPTPLSGHGIITLPPASLM